MMPLYALLILGTVMLVIYLVVTLRKRFKAYRGALVHIVNFVNGNAVFKESGLDRTHPETQVEVIHDIASRALAGEEVQWPGLIK